MTVPELPAPSLAVSVPVADPVVTATVASVSPLTMVVTSTAPLTPEMLNSVACVHDAVGQDSARAIGPACEDGTEPGEIAIVLMT